MSIMKCIHFVLLKKVMFGIFLLNIHVVKSEVQSDKKVVYPTELIPHMQAYFPEIDPYVNLQLKLEDIGDTLNLYGLPERKRDFLLKNLSKLPKVRDIISRCEDFLNQSKCKYSLYRSADGSCNNLRKGKWGSSATDSDRLLPPIYEGANEFRKSKSGRKLPLARQISLKLNLEKPLSKRLSALFVFFGQTIAHDVVLSSRLDPDDSANLCENPKLKADQIYYPADDPFFSQFNITCLSFFRNALFPKCNFEKRGIINMATSFIDASEVYGSNNKKSNELRSLDDSGKLLMQSSAGGKLLVKDDQLDTFCIINKTEFCFKTGDGRGNQHTTVAILMNVFARFHNKIADIFHDINPNWKGDKIYQEARRIVIATLQYIIYNEFLPLLLNDETMNKYNLNVDSTSKYDAKTRPITLIEFSTAAYRLHTMLPHIMSKYNSTVMGKTFSFTVPLFQGELDDMLAGTSEVGCNTFGPYLLDGMKNKIYMTSGASFGFDIAALNIQRGRDHGLAPYVDVVQKCTGKKLIRRFDDLQKNMPEEHVNVLKNIYENVADIDLWVGLLFESHLPNSSVGPTSSCIIGEQFNRLKFGDSFFFTHKNGRYPFTKDQLRLIKTFTLSKLICETTNIKQVRKYPLQMPNENNNLVSCEKLPPINLEAWKERRK